MIDIKQYLYIAIGLLILLYVGHREYMISSLNTDVSNLEKAHLITGVNFTECDETLTEQNEAIQFLAIDADKTRKDFEAYKKLPREVKVETKIIYKDVNTTKPREERSCEEYKTIERNTYMLDWNK
ncbi:hypothetical protein [Sulfurimonas sp.]|uniref:hypothetical protein n=1 Tax=Sulfurimonas sp. TaxID=2022749 RepID=UPI0035614B1C